MDKLTHEEVMHVSELARIKLREEEIDKYRVELKQILNSVEKITEVEDYDEEKLIAPWSDNTELRKDEVGDMLNPKEALKNVPKNMGNYIEVPVVIGESEGA